MSLRCDFKNIFILSILILFILSLGIVSANENVSLPSSDSNNVYEDIIGVDDIGEMNYENTDFVEEDDGNFDMGSNILINNSIKPNSELKKESSYMDDIDKHNGALYGSFIRFLLDNCSFEFHDSSFVGDGYLLYSTTNFSGKTFDGVGYAILPYDYYFVSINDRLPYFINGRYYDDVVYCHDNNYYLDE